MLKTINSKLRPIIRDSIPYFYRYGKKYREIYNFINKSERFTKEEIKSHQLKEFKKLIMHCYNNVPYYRRVFEERDLRPSDFKTLKDIEKLPFLTKDIIIENKDDLIATNTPKKYLLLKTTGGSTGEPLEFYEDKRVAAPIEQAFVSQIWKRVGFNPKRSHKFVFLRGNKIDNGVLKYEGKNLILSSYNLTDENIGIYLKEMEKFNPDFIQAYPSALEIVSNFIISNKREMKLSNLKAILCSSEKLFSHQRNVATKAFGVRIFNLYGHTEHCVIAGECEYSENLHFQSEYGMVEIINEYGDLVSEEGELGEIVATGFNNYVMPFIRYRTGDMASLTNTPCDCNREYQIIKEIEGRDVDFVITKSGAKVSLTAIIFAQHFNAFGKIRRLQLIQNKIGEVLVTVLENQPLTQLDKEEIINKMEKATNGELIVTVKSVSDIPLTTRGKHKMLISNI